ncbi:FAD-binding oxidoreductase [Wenjunlia tyrosinilytica]|uniref:Alkyldihydroxyacetonephosphate synthase n=1 Tax=Wenjunlia tyrosinilytica TaxID=1544741 RepID=A0A917ZQU2_9ACTN|nr:FAD-binding oxidoreductase [Wenjunlia tyrosinilytica]GGO90066.1 alkyldihydroxyacetonephosphate synthase [Wenjunlia tyrosinilytica]
MTSPAHRVGDMAWNAWGDPARPAALSDSALALVRQALGARPHPLPSATESDVRLPEPALGDDAAARLTAAVGAEHVRTDAATRLRHTGGKSLDDLLRRRGGDAANAPDAVVLPRDHDEVLAVLAACAEHRVAVVPFGGGTSVVGGVEPLRGEFGGAITLDLRRLDRLEAVDTDSMTATLQAGLRTPEADGLLAAHGVTLGHRPQSYEYATIGGYAATRSRGQASTGYGGFDDMVLGLTAATVRGTLRLGRSPASAAGPDLRHLLIGSEGTLGVITSVTCQVRPIPDEAHQEAWAFPDWTTGVTALRRLAQSPVRPHTVRLSDETETFVNAAVSGGRAPSGCLAVMGFEGTADEVAHARRTTRALLERHEGTLVDSSAADDWRRSRTQGPYLRDALLAEGVLAETLETAATWADLLPLYSAVADGVRGALSGDGAEVIVLCHVSHVYRTGASLYFTVVTAAEEDPRAQWAQAKRAAGDAIAASGGTITHHHAVGTDHLPWMTEEVGELGVELLRAAKRVLDPSGILNPGKLIPS